MGTIPNSTKLTFHGSSPLRPMREYGPDGMPVDGKGLGMTLETLREGDFSAFGKVCPQCREPFSAGDQVLESLDQQVQIHVECVRAMQRLLPDDPAAIDAAFHRNRTELADELKSA